LVQVPLQHTPPQQDCPAAQHAPLQLCPAGQEGGAGVGMPGRVPVVRAEASSLAAAAVTAPAANPSNDRSVERREDFAAKALVNLSNWLPSTAPSRHTSCGDLSFPASEDRTLAAGNSLGP
jgi:hypothetical protein